MKPSFKTLAIGVIIFALNGITGCKKDTPAPTPTPTNPTGSGVTTLAAFYAANGVQTQTFTINNSTGGTITGANGGKYFFPANFFQTAAKVVVSGNITIKLKEIFNPANMVLSNMVTTAGTKGLLSEGEFYISAAQGSTPLIANTAFIAHIPLMDSTPQAKDSINVWNFNGVTWGNSYGCYAYSLGSSPDTVVVNSDSINWVNADCYYPNSSFFQLTVNATNSPNISQTAIYVFVNGHKSMWQAWYASGTQFQTPGDIPSGAPLTIIGLCTSTSGTVYTFFLPYTNPGKNDLINVTFSASTASAFTTQLQALK